MRGAGPSLPDLGHWFLLTPALPHPRPANVNVPADWLGPTGDLIRRWDAVASEDEQEVQLRELWDSACAWAATDEVEVEGGIDLDSRQLIAIGFARKLDFSWRRMPFFLTELWSLRGDQASVGVVLRRLRDFPGFTLVARSNGIDRLRLRGDSWDGVYLNIAGLDAGKALDELEAIARRAYGREPE